MSHLETWIWIEAVRLWGRLQVPIMGMDLKLVAMLLQIWNFYYLFVLSISLSLSLFITKKFPNAWFKIVIRMYICIFCPIYPSFAKLFCCGMCKCYGFLILLQNLCLLRIYCRPQNFRTKAWLLWLLYCSHGI